MRVQSGHTESNTIKASITKNGGKLPIVLTVDPKDLPFDFQRVKIEANSDAIRDALEHGQEVPGAELGERGEHIKIG